MTLAGAPGLSVVLESRCPREAFAAGVAATLVSPGGGPYMSVILDATSTGRWTAVAASPSRSDEIRAAQAGAASYVLLTLLDIFATAAGAVATAGADDGV